MKTLRIESKDLSSPCFKEVKLIMLLAMEIVYGKSV